MQNLRRSGTLKVKLVGLSGYTVAMKTTITLISSLLCQIRRIMDAGI